jgi:glycine cleavage system H protein
MNNFPENLKYTREHEWLREEENGECVVGITNYAQKELGDIVFIDIDTEGETLAADEKFGSIEAVKTVSDLYMPVGGKIIAVNPKLEAAPDLVNKAPYGDGWLIRIQMSNPADLNGLMTANDYEELVSE